MLSMPEDRLVARVAAFAGVSRKVTREWLSLQHVDEDKAKACSRAVQDLGVTSDVALIREILKQSPSARAEPGERNR